jgi:putative PIN family toxin of toxin-antitoxin system
LNNPVRAVLDTNSVLSALLFSGGRLSWLRQGWQGGRILPLVSKSTTQELLRVLAYPKFKLSTAEQEELLADYLPYTEGVAISKKISGLPECRDPNDAIFLELATMGRADILVTGDEDLLVLASKFAISIVSPTQFKQMLLTP